MLSSSLYALFCARAPNPRRVALAAILTDDAHAHGSKGVGQELLVSAVLNNLPLLRLFSLIASLSLLSLNKEILKALNIDGF